MVFQWFTNIYALFDPLRGACFPALKGPNISAQGKGNATGTDRWFVGKHCRRPGFHCKTLWRPRCTIDLGPADAGGRRESATCCGLGHAETDTARLLGRESGVSSTQGGTNTRKKQTLVRLVFGCPGLVCEAAAGASRSITRSPLVKQKRHDLRKQVMQSINYRAGRSMFFPHIRGFVVNLESGSCL